MGGNTLLLAAAGTKIDEKERKRLSEAFRKMMSTLYKEEGALLRMELLGEPEVTEFIDTHASILDSPLKQTEMSDTMREHLRRSNWMFSGLKTFHELNEAFPSLIDGNGNKKPFERFLNDVRKIDDTYNKNYLRAEYNFAGAAAQMAERWEEAAKDDEEIYLQYRTAHDGKVRPEHAELHGITLPMSDKFWDEYYPPNGWNCRCSVEKVLRFKSEPTPHEEAMKRAEKVFRKDKKGMFKFNPGKEQRTFPAYNPYTISKCHTCDKSNLSLAKGDSIPQNQLCAACRELRNISDSYTIYPTENGRVRILADCDKNEMGENTKIASYFANKYGHQIDLLPRKDGAKSADTFNISLDCKQEYKVCSKASVNAIDMAIKKGKKQANSIVIGLNTKMPFGDLKEAIVDRVQRSSSITDITIILKDDNFERYMADRTYTREEILSDNFKIRREDFK